MDSTLCLRFFSCWQRRYFLRDAKAQHAVAPRVPEQRLSARHPRHQPQSSLRHGIDLLGNLAGVLFLLLLVFTPSISIAQEPIPPQPQGSPGDFIQNLGDEAIGYILDQSLTQAQRSEKYRELLRKAFDMKTIAHFAIGRAWDSATPEQRQEYLQLFEELVLNIYGDRLSFYSGERFEVKGVRRESDRDSVVTSEIKHAGRAQATSVDWRVRNENGKYAIIDVVIDGVSQSVAQRQDYSSVIRRDGGRIDGLITVLRQRVQEMRRN